MSKITMLIGAPGSGKGAQGNILINSGWLPVSTGNLLRQETETETERGIKLRALISNGNLVPDDLIIDIFKEHLLNINNDKILLDGFPRTLVQAQAMYDLGLFPENIVVFVASDEVLVKRITGRWYHLPSGRVYHEEYSPPAIAGLDDITGDQLIRRADDNKDIIRARLDIYYKNILPILSFYHAVQQVSTMRICYINADDSIENIALAIKKVIL